MQYRRAIGVRIENNRYVNGSELMTCYQALLDRIAELEKQLKKKKAG